MPRIGMVQRQWLRGYTIVEIVLTLTIAGILVTLANANYQSYVYRMKVTQTASDITAISMSIARFELEQRRFPTTLAQIGKDTMRDPWGNAYQYIDHSDGKKTGQWRKDKKIHPINSDFDLFSMGKDGKSAPPLTAQPSRDDIIRANDGAFVGLASDYDP